MSKMNTILFRADANPSVGFGHIMRCLSIADSAASFNQEVLFILADNTVQGLVNERGYPSIVLGTAYNELEGEAERVSAIIAESRSSALVVDSYFVTKQYLSALQNNCRSVGCVLVYMDDVLAFPYPCDVLLNYNIYGPDADYKGLYQGKKTLPIFLLGTSFAPLRREFQSLAHRIVCRQGKKVLISTGGSDCEHITLELVEEIRKRAGEEITFHVIIGAMNQDKELIYDRAKGCPNVVLHENVKNMSDLMQACDVAISAAGSTLYELCATQTPTITYILADNQIPGAEGFDYYGIMKNCGDIRMLGGEELAHKLLEATIELCSNYEKRVQIAEKMFIAVDGQGAERIVMKLLKNNFI